MLESSKRKGLKHSQVRRLASSGLLTLVAALAMQAAPFLPNVSNLNFVDYTGLAPKNAFSLVDPVGWTGGTGFIFIDAPGTATSGIGGLPIYGPFPDNSPVGGNFVQADGNPVFESGFNQLITGLTPGTTYTLSFYQAAGQQLLFDVGVPTTEQWVVSLGKAGLGVDTSGGPYDPVYGPTASYFNTDPNASIAISQAMITPSGGVTPWQYVSVNLTADSTTELLSFLAWGDNGSTVNLPPMVFLSGVNSPDVICPEPSMLCLFLAAIAGLAVFLLIKRTCAAQARG